MSGLVVLAVAAFLLAQGIVAFVRPQAARTFLGGFAASAKVHFCELAARIVAGLGFVHFAPFSRVPAAFEVAGWVLVATSAVMLFVPWRLHRQFAQWAVPMATRHMRPYAAGCLVGAAAIVYGMLPGGIQG